MEDTKIRTNFKEMIEEGRRSGHVEDTLRHENYVEKVIMQGCGKGG